VKQKFDQFQMGSLVFSLVPFCLVAWLSSKSSKKV